MRHIEIKHVLARVQVVRSALLTVQTYAKLQRVRQRELVRFHSWLHADKSTKAFHAPVVIKLKRHKAATIKSSSAMHSVYEKA